MDTLAVLQHLHDAREAVGDPSKMVGSIANRAQRILDSIAAAVDLIEKGYEPEHAPMNVHAAIERIRTAREYLHADEIQQVERCLNEALADLHESEHARPAEWESTGDQARDLREMRGDFHPAYREGFRAGFDEAEQARADAARPALSDEQADRLQAMAEQTGDEPTIEVLPLPGDRFVLVFSGWPQDSLVHGWDDATAARWREMTGAAAVYVAPHPVYLPDGYRATWGEGK
jgi:hypothetical protein